MLNKIEIKNVFAHKDTTITFQKGLTRIHGSNEAGKSQVFEMVRWALFGNKALRTSSDDYKGGSVTLTFHTDYIVHRTTGSATLHKGSELLARSSTAVNKKIIEIIGYGLKTFDNVNSIQQDEVQKLTKMPSVERKKFLDELIGAAQIDQLTAEYKAESQILDAEKRAIEGSIVPIQEPKTPKYPLTAQQITEVLDSKNVDLMEYQVQKRGVDNLRAEVNKSMVMPDMYPDVSVQELEQRLEAIKVQDEKIKEARVYQPFIVKLVDAGAPRDLDINSLRRDISAVLQARQTKRPQWNAQEVKDLVQKHRENDAHKEVLRLKAELETYQRCPGFEKENEATVKKINALLPSAKPHSALPSREALVEAEYANQEYAKTALALAQVKSKYAELATSEIDFAQKDYETIYDLVSAPTEDVVSIFQSLDTKRRAIELFIKQKELEIKEKELAAIDIDDLQGHISRLKTALADRQRYDFELESYTEGLKKNEEVRKKLALKKAEYAESLKVVKALQGFKYYINTYFLPSVGKAASAMLVTMTNGQRKRISITDKFEITVDGQQVEALSGSTKAIVNIALRFALQFVLTKNSFSVFMADEVDGAMDVNRANYLNECLGNMVEHISQVIVISHKDIVAPNNIKL